MRYILKSLAGFSWLIAILILFCTFSFNISTAVAQSTVVENVQSGVFPATYYRIEAPLNCLPPSQEIFGGLISQMQAQSFPFWKEYLCLCIIILSILSIFLPYRIWKWLSIISLFCISAFLSIKASEGWDELYIGAKHALNMAEHNRFTYTLSQSREATGEFLPLFFAGLFAKLGLPLPEDSLAMGLVGNLWLIISVWGIFTRLNSSKIVTLLFSAASAVFPCVILVSVSGFFSPLFSAAIVAAIDLLFLNQDPKRRKAGVYLLALLTLIRIEGIGLAFILWLYIFIILKFKQLLFSNEKIKTLKEAIINGTIIAAPFCIASAVRLYVFGNIFPAAAALKNVQGDPDYLKTGIEYLHSVDTAFCLQTLAYIAIPALILSAIFQNKFRNLISVLLIVALFSVPYVIGGGDWFPASWARYLMPFILLAYLSTWISWSYLSQQFCTKFTAFKSILPVAVAVLLTVTPYSLQYILKGEPLASNAFQFMNDVLSKADSTRWGRIDRLGCFGKFLDQTLPKDSAIASAEEATIMFYAKRDAVDLAGFASSEIAYGPKQPLRAGDVMHRKRNPEVIKKYKPGVIAFWEMAHLQNPPFTPASDPGALETADGLVRLYGHSQPQIDVAYYRAGSFKYIQKLGYKFIAVMTSSSLFWYWVDEKILPYHIQALTQLGAHEMGQKEISYAVTPEIANKFTSGEELH